VNTRARFQRLKDAKFFSGWVRDLTAADVLIQVTEPISTVPGELFLIQVHGRHQSALFKASLRVFADRELVFNIHHPIRFTKATESMRLLIDGMTGLVTAGTQEIEVLVVDLSEKGAGVLLPCGIEKNEAVTLRIDSSQGQIVCLGQVRYCKPDPQMPGQYRAGILLRPDNRVDQARWQRLIGSDAA
jgi:hypothetical protein